jgi:hypothetical protein
MHGFTCVKQPVWVDVKKNQGEGGNRNFKRLETKALEGAPNDKQALRGFSKFLS